MCIGGRFRTIVVRMLACRRRRSGIPSHMSGDVVEFATSDGESRCVVEEGHLDSSNLLAGEFDR